MPGTTIAIVATLLALAAVAVLAWWLYGIRAQAKILARIGPALVEAPVFFKLVEISHEKSHFLERHGPMLQRCDVLQRAKTGKLDVAGFVGRPVASAKWYNHQDMLHAILSAAEYWRAGDRPKSGKYVFAFDEPIGEGFLKGETDVVETKIAAVIIRKDYVVTAFPVLAPLDESHLLK